MSHHGREYEDDKCGTLCTDTAAKLRTAVKLISDIAENRKMDPSAAADTWLDRNGYDCESSRRRQRERRAEQLDAEIARLQAEREKL